MNDEEIVQEGQSIINAAAIDAQIEHVENISYRKLGIVSTASFDTLIKAITDKSEAAQCTFAYRLLGKVPEEVLATIVKYADSEVRKRARA